MNLGSLTTAQRQIYDQTVAGSHSREVELLLTTRDGEPVGSFTNAHLGGGIAGDANGSPVMVCDVDFLDPEYTINWSHGAHRRFDLQVTDSRFIPELDDWVDEQTFTGPIWDYTRDGPVVSLVAHDSARKAMGSIDEVYTAPWKTKATKVIRELLRLAGANPSDMSIPMRNERIPESITVGVKRGKKREGKRKVFRSDVEDTWWGEALEVAEAIDRDLYVNGRGRFLLRAERTRPSLRLTKNTLVSQVQENPGDDTEEQVNTWRVIGANPKGRPQVEVEVELPRWHPASAHKQAWNEKPRRIIEVIENPKLRNKAAARKLGRKHRNRAMRETTAYDIEALPILGWIRPNMLATAPTPGGRVTARVQQWSIPLGPGADPLVLGATRRHKRGRR